MSSTTVVKDSIRGQTPYSIRWVRSKDGATWELIRALRYSDSSVLSVWAYLQPTSFIERIFLSLHTWGRRYLSSVHVSQSEHWRLENVRFWKLSRTYPGEKPSSLSVPTHKDCLSTRKSTQHLLAMSRILVRIRALYNCPIPCSVPPPLELLLHFPKIFNMFLFYLNN